MHSIVTKLVLDSYSGWCAGAANVSAFLRLGRHIPPSSNQMRNWTAQEICLVLVRPPDGLSVSGPGCSHVGQLERIHPTLYDLAEAKMVEQEASTRSTLRAREWNDVWNWQPDLPPSISAT